MRHIAVAAVVALLAHVPASAREGSASRGALRRCDAAVTRAGERVMADAFARFALCDAHVARGGAPAGTDCESAIPRGPSARRASRVRDACRHAAFSRGGDCADASTADALAACIGGSHAAYVGLAADVLGAPAARLGREARRCRATAVRSLAHVAVGSLRALQRCKRRPPADLPPGTACADAPAVAFRGAALRDAATRAILHDCDAGAIAIAFGPTCAGAPDRFAACVLGAGDDAATAAAGAEHPDPGFCGDAGRAVERRVDDLVARMTRDEKIGQMHGEGVSGPSTTAAVPRLGLPGFLMNDGPRGVGFVLGHATAFPVGIARGATWDPALESRVGAAMATEARAKGATVLLAPTMNVVRHPRGGRTQESYGEDTFHLGAMAAAFVRGVQGRGVIASVKHFALNSIEDTRFVLDVSVDERALREIYLPHFRRAVREGHAGSVMSAYNKVNGAYCAENPHLLRDVLKGDWGFQGFVESDWVLGTRSTVPSLEAGLDIEMPSGVYYGPPLVAALDAHEIDESALDDHVRRIVRAQLCFRLDAEPPVVDPSQVETAAHAALAREIAQKGIVLLKNAGAALPLDRTQLHTLAVVGAPIPTPTQADPAATTSMAAFANLGDFGSSTVVPSAAVTPLDGIRDAAGAVAVTHVASLHRAPCAPGDDACAPAIPPDQADAIASADAAVVIAGLAYPDEGEGLITHGDRDSLALPRDQDAIVAAVASLNPRTIVVLEGSGPVLMPWLAAVPAVVEAWYPGEEGGRAIADVLFGDVNPSGKLPLSFPQAAEDLPPFDDASSAVVYDYWHGYRHLDRHGTAPLFPFGHGLSYATFAYDHLTIRPAVLGPWGRLRVTADVTNTGAVAGEEVVQLYVGYDGSRVERAVDDLKGFARVRLEPGETKPVTFELAARDAAFWNVAAGGWEVEPIAYRVRVGPSSRSLPLEGSFVVPAPAAGGPPPTRRRRRADGGRAPQP